MNRGPGSFAGIRNSLSIVKALHLVQKIDYYSFSFGDFLPSIFCVCFFIGYYLSGKLNPERDPLFV